MSPARRQPYVHLESQREALVNLVVGSRTDRGRRRRRNEDRVLIRSGRGEAGAWTLLAVADGMGGAAAGDIASEEALRAFDDDIVGCGAAPDAALLRAFGVANARVRSLSGASPKLAGMGTTLVAAIVARESAWIANVGDSRAYLCGKQSFVQITRDHSLVEEELRVGVLTPEEAVSSRYRAVLTRNLGSRADVATDVFGPIRLTVGDSLMLCSDGLHAVVQPEEMQVAVRSMPAQESCDQLVALANERGGPDNISVIVAATTGKERGT